MFRYTFGGRQARRQAIETGFEIQYATEWIAIPVVLFLVVVLPLLVNPSLFFQPAAWLWWIKAQRMFLIITCVGIYAIAHAWHLPIQLTGAAVDAMGQAKRKGEKLVVFFEGQRKPPYELLPLQLAPRLVIAACQVFARARQLVRQIWDRPPQAYALFFPSRRTIPPSTFIQEPSA